MRYETDTVVLGGGVTGLCAAWYLTKALGADQVLLVEANDHVGGTATTERTDGFLRDRGPNGFLDREPRTIEWVDDLGLSGEVVKANENAEHRFIMKNGELVEVLPPPKFLLTPLLSIPGRLRLCCEPLIKQKQGDEPETIWNFAARRIGAEAADTLVSAMVTGIYGGDAKQLSLFHCFPRMAAMEREYGTLFKALKAKKRENPEASAAGPGGILTSFREGIGFLPEQVRAKLGDRVLTGVEATRVAKANGAWRVETRQGDEIEARRVVIAMPTYSAANLFADLDDALATTLNDVPYADIAVLTTAYPRDKVGHDMTGFGFLVPGQEKKRTLGCIWTSSIFPNQAPEDWVMLRSMYGGYLDPEAVRLSDDELLGHLRSEVHPLLGIESDPEFMRVYRWRPGIPQYLLNHGNVLDAIAAAEDRHGGIVFAGNAYRGVGINDCVLSAHRAIDRLLAAS